MFSRYIKRLCTRTVILLPHMMIRMNKHGLTQISKTPGYSLNSTARHH